VVLRSTNKGALSPNCDSPAGPFGACHFVLFETIAACPPCADIYGFFFLCNRTKVNFYRLFCITLYFKHGLFTCKEINCQNKIHCLEELP
jgi:hypothetical protein